MERILEFDFSELKVHYAVEKGLPSNRFATENRDFITWVMENISLAEFRHDLGNMVWANIEQKLKNKLTKSKNANDVVIIKGYGFVFRGDSLVTILDKKGNGNV